MANIAMGLGLGLGLTDVAAGGATPIILSHLLLEAGSDFLLEDGGLILTE